MPAGGPAPRDAWKPRARCPAQPEVSLKAFEPEAPPPTTMPARVPQHGGPSLADQPPLPGAGPAPPGHFAVPVIAYPPPPPAGPSIIPAHAPPAPAPALPLRASSPITSYSKPLAPAPVPIENLPPNTFSPASFVNSQPY